MQTYYWCDLFGTLANQVALLLAVASVLVTGKFSMEHNPYFVLNMRPGCDSFTLHILIQLVSLRLLPLVLGSFFCSGSSAFWP